MSLSSTFGTPISLISDCLLLFWWLQSLHGFPSLEFLICYLFQILYCFYFSTENCHLFLYYLHPFLLFLEQVYNSNFKVFANCTTSVISQFVFIDSPLPWLWIMFSCFFSPPVVLTMGKHLGNICILLSFFNGCWLLFRQVFNYWATWLDPCDACL